MAYDQLKNPTSTGVTEEREFRKERWLEFHDRFTSGIPGVFPAVVDLPVRFTESVGREAREMGVFKHTRGILRGWGLEQEEKERLANTTLSEVVLKRRPLSLYIEVHRHGQNADHFWEKDVYTQSSTETMEPRQSWERESHQIRLPNGS